MTTKYLLDKANGKRHKRLLSQSNLSQLIDDVKNSYYYSTMNGGTVNSSYGYRAATTVALAACVNGKIYLGIKECQAYKASPGRAWKCLQPWGCGDMDTKLKEWVNSSDVVEIK